MQHCCFELINARFSNPIFDLYMIQHALYIHYSTFMLQNPTFNFFNSTLRTDNSTSIFQILFTCNIRLCVFVCFICVASQSNIPCFTSSQTKGHILNPTFLRLHATFVYLTAIVSNANFHQFGLTFSF